MLSQLNPSSPGLTPHQLLRHGFGKRQQPCPGRDAPKGRAGGCLCTSLAGSQEEGAGLKIIQSPIKTHLSRQRHLHGKQQRENSFNPQFGEGRVRDDQVKPSQADPKSTWPHILVLGFTFSPVISSQTGGPWRGRPHLGADFSELIMPKLRQKVKNYQIMQDSLVLLSSLSKKICRTTKKRCCFPGKTAASHSDPPEECNRGIGGVSTIFEGVNSANPREGYRGFKWYLHRIRK